LDTIEAAQKRHLLTRLEEAQKANLMTTQIQPANKSSRAKFVELASKRVNNALNAIRLIGNLSNRSTYSYTKDDITKIFRAIDEEVQGVRQRFEHTKSTDKASFQLE
jgi:hypothetical protein